MVGLWRAVLVGFLIVGGNVVADSKLDRIPVLIKALEDANVRQGASIALTRLGAKTVPALRKSLTSDNAQLVTWSAYTLGQIGPEAKSAVGDLTKALEHSDPAVRAASAQSLGKIGNAASAAVHALARALNDEREEVRLSSAVALGQIGTSSQEAIKKLIDLLSESRARKLAREALIQIGKPAVPRLLKSVDRDVIRFDVTSALRKIDPETAKKAGLEKPTMSDLSALRLVLHDLSRDPAERTRAASALASLGIPAVPVLINAFEAKEPIARAAATAFGEVGAVAVPDLIKASEHENAEVRAKVADALGHIGPAANDALPRLVTLMNDRDRTVRYHAVLALHSFEKKAIPAVPALVEVLLDSKQAEQTRVWALKSLLVTLPETHDVVVKALIKATSEKTNYGVRQLARQKVKIIDSKAAETAGVK